MYANGTTSKIIETRNPKSKFGRATSPPLTQEMYSSAVCATTCAVPTARESNHLAAGMLYVHTAVHILPIRYLRYLRCSIPSHCRIPTFTIQKSPTGPRPTRPTTPNDIIGAHTLNFYCYYLCTINWTNLSYLNVIADARASSDMLNFPTKQIKCHSFWNEVYIPHYNILHVAYI